jgi:hypothetical protein
MRPLFAIAPLALAFALLGPTTTEAASNTGESLVMKAWHLVFDRDSNTAPAKSTDRLRDSSATLAH